VFAHRGVVSYDDPSTPRTRIARIFRGPWVSSLVDSARSAAGYSPPQSVPCGSSVEWAFQ